MGTPQVVATISTFILAMVLFSDVQHKAQEEIDRVIGTGLLPNVTDRDHLLYLSALYKELLRWPHGYSSSLKTYSVSYNIFPGIPHSTTQDDLYGDYSTSYPKARSISGESASLTINCPFRAKNDSSH
jgi:hypothetical protein